MEDRMRRKVQEIAKRLLAEEKNAFRRATTLRDIEDLTAEIGDELTRQLANSDLSERAEEVREQGVGRCPDCEREFPIEKDPEPILLEGPRGEIEYLEPRCYCPSCRRTFFPSGSVDSAFGSRNRDTTDA